jgi:hypothetical protein
MHWPRFNLQKILRVSHGVLFIFSLPLLLAALLYAGETLFWREGPATDYPILTTPRPTPIIRIHGLLCLLSAIALTGISGLGMANNNWPLNGKQKLNLVVHVACITCIWWNPWTTGLMDKEELLARSFISCPFIFITLLDLLIHRKHGKSLIVI